MNIAINVYEYGRGGKCEYIFRHTYTGIRGMKMQMEKESRLGYEKSFAYINTNRVALFY